MKHFRDMILLFEVFIYPTLPSSDIGLAYPTAVYARSISSQVYPTSMYTRSISLLV